MSDTPRTDAALLSTRYCHVEDEWKTAKKMLEIARTLERELNALRAGVPYPKFCVHPEKCQGLSNCPRDPICAD